MKIVVDSSVLVSPGPSPVSTGISTRWIGCAAFPSLKTLGHNTVVRRCDCHFKSDNHIAYLPPPCQAESRRRMALFNSCACAANVALEFFRDCAAVCAGSGRRWIVVILFCRYRRLCRPSPCHPRLIVRGCGNDQGIDQLGWALLILITLAASAADLFRRP